MVELRQGVSPETWTAAVAAVGPPESVATSIAATLREALEASDDSARWRRGLLTVALLAAAAAEAAMLAGLEEGGEHVEAELRRAEFAEPIESAAARLEASWREMMAAAIPCGHRIGDLIWDAQRRVTKCGACIATLPPREVRHVVRFTAERLDAGQSMIAHRAVLVLSRTDVAGGAMVDDIDTATDLFVSLAPAEPAPAPITVTLQLEGAEEVAASAEKAAQAIDELAGAFERLNAVEVARG